MLAGLARVMTSPMLADRFNVVRRLETVSAKGRSTVAATRFENQRGVVCAASNNDLERLEEADRMGSNITIVTSFALRGPSKEGAKVFKPDLVEWRGSTYVVKSLDQYPQYGAGFVQAICGSTDVVDEVQ